MDGVLDMMDLCNKFTGHFWCLNSFVVKNRNLVCKHLLGEEYGSQSKRGSCTPPSHGWTPSTLGATPPPAEENFCRARRFQEETFKTHVHPSLDSVLEVFLTQHCGREIDVLGQESQVIWPHHAGPLPCGSGHLRGCHTSALPLPWRLAGSWLSRPGSAAGPARLCVSLHVTVWLEESGWCTYIAQRRWDKRQLWLSSLA